MQISLFVTKVISQIMRRIKFSVGDIGSGYLNIFLPLKYVYVLKKASINCVRAWLR